MPRLIVSPDTHPRLWSLYMLHPEIVHVFENIRFDRGLATHVPPPRRQREMLPVYIETLFLPILLEGEVIARDPSRKCGWCTTVESITFTAPRARVQLAETALANAENIARTVTDSDSIEDTILAFVSGRQAPTVTRKFFTELKDLVRRHLNDEYDESSEACGWRLAVIGKVYDQ